MDYDINLESLKQKNSDFQNLNNEVANLKSSFDGNYINTLSSSEIGNVTSEISDSVNRLSTAYNNCEQWFQGYCQDLETLENSLASFSAANVTALLDFKGEFNNIFSKSTIPTLQTGGDPSALSNNSEENVQTVLDNNGNIVSLTYTYQTSAGPTTVFYSIIPSSIQPKLAIATDSNGNISYKLPWEFANEIGAKYAINFSVFGSGRKKPYDGGRGVDYDGKNLFIGSRYNCDTTLYMSKDGYMGYIDNKTFKSKSDVATTLENKNVMWAAKGFYPIIDNYQYVNNNTDSNIGGSARHPRTFIGQLENGDYIMGVCSGRNTNDNGQYEHGMTLKEVGDFVQNYATDANGNKIKVRFLMNGDGGGSSAYVVDGEKKNVSGSDRETTDIIYL